MPALNLLPPAEKEKLVYVWRVRALIVIASGFIAVLAVSFVLLLPTFFLLAFQKTEAIRAVAIERDAEERTGLTKRVEIVERANRLGVAVRDHEAKRGDLFGLFESLFRNVPAGIRLESIPFRSKTRELTISGFAPARQVLLLLLKNMEENPRIAKVSSPVANLIREADINFSVAVTLRP